MNGQEIRTGSGRGNPYRVPEGYFAELRNRLREEAAGLAAENAVGGGGECGWRGRIVRLAGAAACFGCLVLFAVVGFYFTGYRAQQRELLAQEGRTEEMLLGYRFYAEDVEELEEYLEDEEDGTRQGWLAEEVNDYLDIYGYGGVDFAVLLDED